MAETTETNVELITVKTDTEERLKSKGTVLEEGEFFNAKDTDRMRVGDGKTKGIDRPVFLDSEKEHYIHTIDGVIESRNLAEVFADEIASGKTSGGTTFTAGSAWKWISARRKEGNFEGIHLWDFIPLKRKAGTVGTDTYTAATINAYITDIDSDFYYSDTRVGHHIDFCAGTLGKNVKWQVTDNNNGTAKQQIVWLTTNLYAYLNGVNNYTTNAYNSVAHGADYSAGGYVNLMPDDLQEVMREFRMYLPKRYSKDGLLTQANAGGWCDAGKIRPYTEIEMYGSAISSYSQNLSDGGINFDNIGSPRQRAAFKYACIQKIIGRTDVWTLSSTTGVATRACLLSNNGNTFTFGCTATWVSCPVAFRL